MKKHDKQTDQQRRTFLRGSVATGAGVVIAGSVTGVAVATDPDKSEPSVNKQSGYQLSQHVLDYYKSCMR